MVAIARLPNRSESGSCATQYRLKLDQIFRSHDFLNAICPAAVGERCEKSYTPSLELGAPPPAKKSQLGRNA